MNLLKRFTDDDFMEKLEFNRFAIMAIGMTFQSCLASVAVYEILKNLSHEDNLIPLCILAPICMASNALALAQAGMKWVMGGLFLSTFTSICLLAYVYIFA